MRLLIKTRNLPLPVNLAARSGGLHDRTDRHHQRQGRQHFCGYLASPAPERGPGIVVIQEIFGVNQVMRDIADGLAARGFFALVPDLFWRMQPGVELTDHSDAEWQQAFGLMQRFDTDKGVEDIQATINHLRRPGRQRQGRRLGLLPGRAARLSRRGAHRQRRLGGLLRHQIQDRLEEAAKIDQPLMLHIAEADEFTPAGAQEKIRTG